MTQAPAFFQTTLSQRLQRAGAAGFAAVSTIAVLTQGFDAGHWPTTHRIAIVLLTFAVPAVAGYTGLVPMRVAVDRNGVLITTRGRLSTTFTPWTQISHVQTRRRFGRTRVVMVTLSGANIVLPVPYSGLLFEKNHGFTESAQVIRSLKNDSSAADSNE